MQLFLKILRPIPSRKICLSVTLLTFFNISHPLRDIHDIDSWALPLTNHQQLSLMWLYMNIRYQTEGGDLGFGLGLISFFQIWKWITYRKILKWHFKAFKRYFWRKFFLQRRKRRKNVQRRPIFLQSGPLFKIFGAFCTEKWVTYRFWSPPHPLGWSPPFDPWWIHTRKDKLIRC